MTVIGDGVWRLGRAEAALARIFPGGGSSFTNSGSPPQSPGRPGRGQAFSGHGSHGCGRSGSIIDNMPRSSEALLAASHLAGAGGQGALAPGGQGADSAQRLSLSSLTWVETNQPSGGPSSPLGGGAPSGWSSPRPLMSAGWCPVQPQACGGEKALRQQGTQASLMVSQRTLFPFQPPLKPPRAGGVRAGRAEQSL